MRFPRLLIGLALGACMLAGWGDASAQAIDFDKASVDAKAAIPVTSEEAAALPMDSVKRINERYVSHLEWQFEFAQRSWNWHFWSTILLFVIVLLIVAFGLYITYLQFQRDYGAKPGGAVSGPTAQDCKPTEAGHELAPVEGGANTTMKLTAAGLELSSQIIGLFVLGFSLAFFYLYVKEVYPVQVLNLNQTNPQETAAKVKGSESTPTEPGEVKP